MSLLTEKELLLALEEIPAGRLSQKQLTSKLKKSATSYPQILEKILQHPSMIHQLWNAYLDREAVLSDVVENDKSKSILPMTAQLTLEYFRSYGGFSIPAINSLLRISAQKTAASLRDVHDVKEENFKNRLQSLQLQVFIAALSGAQLTVTITHLANGSVSFHFVFNDTQAQQRFVQTNGAFCMLLSGRLLEKQSFSDQIVFHIGADTFSSGGLLSFDFQYIDELKEVETIKILNIDLTAQ